MAVPLEQFVKQLEASGILDGDTLKGFIPPNAAPKDAEELARELVRRKKLTKFQAEVVYRGRSKLLVLGNYVLMEKIGAGGMGEVFKAEHRRMKRVVAVKILPATMTTNKAAIARFERDVEAAAKVSHPNIVAAYDADQANGVRFLVMELVEGVDLSALVKKNGPLPVEKAVNYILQAAKGLEAAHVAGIVHRDIKPANLLLDNKGIVKILDMGLARLSGDDDGPPQANLTSTGALMGTVDYIAPEQALDTKTADARADIYSLGCSLFYLLTGKATYDGETLTAKLLAHRQEPIPSLRLARPEVPEQIDAVFSKMVAKRVDDRYQSMTEVVATLEAVSSGGLASTVNFERGPSAEERKRIGKSLAPLVQVVASEKSKHLLAKIIGGTFATIIAPILVTFVIKRLENDDPPPKLPTTANAPLVVGDDPAGDPDRRAAEWVLGRGGTITIEVDGRRKTINEEMRPVVAAGDSLPRGHFQLEDVILHGKSDIGDADLIHLDGLKHLSTLGLNGTNVTAAGLRQLQAMTGLETLTLDGTPLTDAGLVHLVTLKRLKTLDVNSTKVTAAGIANLQAALPDCKIEWDDPAEATAPVKRITNFDFQRWMKDVAAMPAQKQVEAVALRLRELNPNFVGKVTPKIQNGVVTELSFVTNRIRNIYPVRALKGLRVLRICPKNSDNKSRLFNLSPLRGLPLTKLDCSSTDVSDLSPLHDCKSLESLNARNTNVTSAGVAALQVALPDCKIEWDDPANR